MSFQHVSTDLSGVASREIGWHSQPFLDGLKIGGLLNCNSEAGIFDVLHPASAATAVWILVNKDRGSLGERTNRRHDQRQRDYPEGASPRQTASVNGRWTTHDASNLPYIKHNPSRRSIECKSM